MRPLRCLVGLHAWVSTLVGVVPTVEGAGFVVLGREFWMNRCARCPRTAGPTWRYDRP